MRFWLVIVGLGFVAAEFFLWIKDIILPLPLYIFGGAFLALASNYEKGIFSSWQQGAQSLPNAPLSITNKQQSDSE